MADNANSTRAPFENNNASPKISRRAVLAAVPLAAVAIMPAATARAHPAVPVDRREWDAAFQLYKAAEQEDAAFRLIFDEVDARRSLEIEAIPHAALPANPYFGVMQPTTTANWNYINRAREQVASDRARAKPLTRPNAIECSKLCIEAVALSEDRDKRVQSVEQRLGYDAMEQRWTDLGDRVSAARWALMSTPAPDLPSLGWKLEYLLRDDEGEGSAAWSNDFLMQTRADIMHLLGGEAAHV